MSAEKGALGIKRWTGAAGIEVCCSALPPLASLNWLGGGGLALRSNVNARPGPHTYPVLTVSKHIHVANWRHLKPCC